MPNPRCMNPGLGTHLSTQVWISATLDTHPQCWTQPSLIRAAWTSWKGPSASSAVLGPAWTPVLDRSLKLGTVQWQPGRVQAPWEMGMGVSPTDHADHCLLLPGRSMASMAYHLGTLWKQNSRAQTDAAPMSSSVRKIPRFSIAPQYPAHGKDHSSVHSPKEYRLGSASREVHNSWGWILGVLPVPELEYKHKDRCPYARGLAQPRAQSQAPTATACGQCVCPGPAVLMGPLGAVLWFLPLPTCARNWPPKAISGYFYSCFERAQVQISSKRHRSLESP